MTSEFNKIKKVHFIGIGGIGISAVARMMQLNGKEVSGSDAGEGGVVDELRKIGIKVSIGHRAENLSKDTDLVIYTIAINPNNPEFLKARELGIKTLSYPESLGLISKDKFTIAISGTHGKTTTTAMIAKMMVDTKLDPTVIVGSFMKTKDVGLESRNTNFIAGGSDYLVVEACEYRRSFLNINPKIAVITNIDDDHLDYYKDIKDIQSAFREFVLKVPKDGFVVCDFKSKYIKDVIKSLVCNVVDYGKINVEGLKLKVPGKHNLQNAKVAVAVGQILDINKTKIFKSLSDFSGTWRRAEHKGITANDVSVYDDYGHHPTEILATLSAFRSIFPKNKITVVFQPHLYSRTKLLIEKFAKVFSDADRVILTPIYAAREPFDPTVSSKDLMDKIKSKDKNKEVMVLNDFEEIENYLKTNTVSGEVVVTMGAGDVYKIGENLLKNKK
jgi:UDP-N-acetylmuramate--alanine ligase